MYQSLYIYTASYRAEPWCQNSLRQLLKITLENRKQAITSVEFAVAVPLFINSMWALQVEHQKWRWDFSCRYIFMLSYLYLFSRFDHSVQVAAAQVQDTCTLGSRIMKANNCPQHSEVCQRAAAYSSDRYSSPLATSMHGTRLLQFLIISLEYLLTSLVLRVWGPGHHLFSICMANTKIPEIEFPLTTNRHIKKCYRQPLWVLRMLVLMSRSTGRL